MKSVARPLRIEPAFDHRESVRELFELHGPYEAAAAYLPDGGPPKSRRAGAVQAEMARPWFRGNWARGGEPLVSGVEPILHNPIFIAAAQAAFGGATVVPKTVVVNVNPPMPAGVPHVDVPSFRGATREGYPLLMLLAMGASGLFEPWRTVEAGAIAWFYDGPGGAFDYWPDGLAGPMLSERPPFGNVAVVGDNDRMYHRIGQVGPPNAASPLMTARAVIAPVSGGWTINEDGESRAFYPASAVRLSLLWKAELPDYAENAADPLELDQVMNVLTRDLRGRGLLSGEPTDPFNDPDWIDLLTEAYSQASPRRPSVAKPFRHAGRKDAPQWGTFESGNSPIYGPIHIKSDV